MPTPRTCALGALLALTVGGCSFRVVRPPPPPEEWPSAPKHGSPEARCTDSLFPPAADTTAVVVLDSVAFIERNAQSRPTPIILALSSIPVAISAIYGYIVVAECRRYHRLYDEH